MRTFPHGFVLMGSACCGIPQSKIKDFCQLPQAGSLCGQCPRPISHGSFLRIVTSLTRPVSAACPPNLLHIPSSLFPKKAGCRYRVEIDVQPKAPLAKGGWFGKAKPGGFRRRSLRNFLPNHSSLFTKKPSPFHIGLYLGSSE